MVLAHPSDAAADQAEYVHPVRATFSEMSRAFCSLKTLSMGSRLHLGRKIDSLGDSSSLPSMLCWETGANRNSSALSTAKPPAMAIRK
jgi:hypothetical protein